MSYKNLTILVGTTKGAFLISGGGDRLNWTVKGPLCDGWPINHIVGDPAPAPFQRVAVVNGMAQEYGVQPIVAKPGILQG